MTLSPTTHTHTRIDDTHTTHTHTHTHVYVFCLLFWIPSRRPAKRTGCHAGKGAEPRAVPNLVVKMLMLKASGSTCEAE